MLEDESDFEKFPIRTMLVNWSLSCKNKNFK
jgi:hypothetical protein